MIGDQKQLGPTYSFEYKGPTSLFDRFIKAGNIYHFLNTQYRMHDSLLDVPNTLFYNGKIMSGY